jgi:hypothetical protein
MPFEQNKSSGKIPSLMPLLGEIVATALDDDVIQIIIVRGEGEVPMKFIMVAIVIPDLDQALVIATAIDRLDWSLAKLAIGKVLEILGRERAMQLAA